MPSAAWRRRGVRPRCAGVPGGRARHLRGHGRGPGRDRGVDQPGAVHAGAGRHRRGLVDTLNCADDLTVFAPTNSAFAAMDAATMDAAIADPKGLLTTVLTYHVVPGRLAPEDARRHPQDPAGDTSW